MSCTTRPTGTFRESGTQPPLKVTLIILVHKIEVHDHDHGDVLASKRAPGKEYFKPSLTTLQHNWQRKDDVLSSREQ